jgi:hypothetical protein
MADGKTKAKNPRFFAFDAIDLNTYLAKKGVLWNVEEMGRFFQSMLNDLLSGCVRDGCDEFVKGEIFGHAEERMLTKRKQNHEYYQKRKNGIPNAEPAPLVDDAEVEERKPYGAKKNVMLSDSDVASIRNAYPEATDKDFRIAVDRVSLKWSGKFEKPASWTKSVSGAVEQILIARRDEKYYQQKEGLRKEREERKAEKTKMIEGVRNSLNFEPQEKPTVPDEFEVPF